MAACRPRRRWPSSAGIPEVLQRTRSCKHFPRCLSPTLDPQYPAVRPQTCVAVMHSECRCSVMAGQDLESSPRQAGEAEKQCCMYVSVSCTIAGWLALGLSMSGGGGRRRQRCRFPTVCAFRSHPTQSGHDTRSSADCAALDTYGTRVLFFPAAVSSVSRVDQKCVGG